MKQCFISDSFPCIEFNNKGKINKSEINFLISKSKDFYINIAYYLESIHSPNLIFK